MITILRRHHRWLMIVIAILAIPFCFYFTKTDLSATRHDDLGRIYDRTVTRVEFQRNARLFNLARSLGMSTLAQDLTVGASTEDKAYAEFTWNRLVLHHEAERLGIRPNQSEVVEVVRALQPFHGDAGFDINKYNEFAQTTLPSLGFSEAQIEELAADQLALKKLKEIISAGVQIPQSESKENYEQVYGKMNVAVVRLRAEDLAKEVKITDDDIAKYYEAHKAQLKSDEKRKVEFVTFALNEEEKKLTGKPRVDALQKLADRANDFTQALLEKGTRFADVTAKFQKPVDVTGEFTLAAPDPRLAANPDLAQTAFQLTTQEPHSDAVQAGDGFYVLNLAGTTEAKPLTLEEAKGTITEAIKKERLREIASNKGAQLASQIREAIKSRTPLEKVAQDNGAKLDRLPPFTLMDSSAPPDKPTDPKTDAPDLPMIKNAVAELASGEISNFIPTPEGGVVAVFEKRDPIDPAGYEQGKVAFDQRYLRGKRSVIFYEWLRDRRQVAGIQVTRGAGERDG
ncbi:MAG: peptidylprolyl isomerase [Chthoniobacterales bacterium]